MPRKKTKPTGGHWRLFTAGSLRKHLGGPPVTEIKTDADDVPIVKWAGFDDSSRRVPEHRANARLMTASPVLLAACKSALFDLEHTPGGTPKAVANQSLAATLRHAIVAAEGR